MKPKSAHGYDKMTAQAVGAYGERIIEAELLRRGWLPGNLNYTVSNAARFDIIAVRIGGERMVPIRVKTCSPRYSDFQFSMKSSNDPFHIREEGDFMALVAMGESRSNDTIYIAPTSVIQEAILKWRHHYLASKKHDGTDHKDTSQWTLRLKGDATKLNYGFAEKWKDYEENWKLLDG